MPEVTPIVKKIDGQTFYKCPSCGVFKECRSWVRKDGIGPCTKCDTLKLKLAHMTEMERARYMKAKNL